MDGCRWRPLDGRESSHTMGNMMPENLCSCDTKAVSLTSSQDLSIEVMHGLEKAIFTVCATVENGRQEVQDWKQGIVDQKVLVQQWMLKFWKICLLKYANQNNVLLIQDIVMTVQLATICVSVNRFCHLHSMLVFNIEYGLDVHRVSEMSTFCKLVNHFEYGQIFNSLQRNFVSGIGNFEGAMESWRLASKK